MSTENTLMVDASIPSYDVDLYDDAVIADQQKHFKAMRDLGPVVWLPHHGNYAVTRFAELSKALRNWEVFSSALGVAGDEFGCQFSRGGTLTSDPPRTMRCAKCQSRPCVRQKWMAIAAPFKPRPPI